MPITNKLNITSVVTVDCNGSELTGGNNAVASDALTVTAFVYPVLLLTDRKLLIFLN